MSVQCGARRVGRRRTRRPDATDPGDVQRGGRAGRHRDVQIFALRAPTGCIPARGSRSGPAASLPAGVPRLPAIGSVACVAVAFHPSAVRGVGSDGPGEIDYRLARQSVISEYRKGRLARHEVCDAHPELLRAAREVGEPVEPARARSARTTAWCSSPTCSGPACPPHGRCITTEAELRPLAKRSGSFTLLRGRGVPRLLVEPPGPHLPAEPRRPGRGRRPLSRRPGPPPPVTGGRPSGYDLAVGSLAGSPVVDRPSPGAPAHRSACLVEPVAAHNLKTTRSGKVKKRSIVWRMRALLYLAVLAVTVGVAGLAYVVSRVELPVDPTVAPAEKQTSFICSAEVEVSCGASNAMATLHGDQNRRSISLDEIPKVLRDAVIAAEDRNFFEHGGVDPIGIARAAWADIRNKGVEAGWLDDHPAVRQEDLPDRRPHAHPQDQGGGDGGEARAEVLEAGDPRPLPQHDLLRARRLRRAGRVARLLQPRRRGHHACPRPRSSPG